MDLVYQKIQKKTKTKPHSCKCQVCQNMCKTTPCIGTPSDIEKIIDAGFDHKIAPTYWAVGIIMRVHDDVIEMYQPEFIDHSNCAFFINGLCELHNLGLKPTEGKLATHTPIPFDPKTNINWNVAKEWLSPKNREIINRIKSKLDL